MKENSIKIIEEKIKALDLHIQNIEEKIKALDLHIQNYETADCKTSVYEVLQEERNALVDILQDYKRVLKENKLKDKIIDLMAEMINNNDIDEDICNKMGQKENCTEFADKENCKACIKKYFENKAKESEK